MRTKRRLLAIMLALVISLGLATPAMALPEFKIENGVLVKYYGSGGDVVIPDGVTKIGYNAFYDEHDITSITIPSSVVEIEEYAFSLCSGLTSLTIPSSVKTLGQHAFSCCRGLTSLTIPGTITAMEEGVFSDCDGLTSVTISEGITELPRGMFNHCDNLSHVTLPNSLKKIGVDAFYGASLVNVVIPNGVTEIGGAAFQSCRKLVSIEIPNSVTQIGSAAFEFCYDLEHITLPPNLTEISSNLFRGCNSLTNVTIPNGVTKIGFRAFAGCDNLVNVDIPASVQEIGEQAFTYSQSLTHIDIPAGITEIKLGTFSQLRYTSFSSVSIPRSVTKIENNAFGSCKELKDVYYEGSQEEWARINIVNDENSNKYLYSATIHYSSYTPAQSTTVTTPAPQPTITTPSTGFTDVKATDYYATPVTWAVEKGITNGTGNNQFSPNQNCTNAQIITFLWRAYGQPEPTISNPYTNTIPEAYTKAAIWAYEKGMVSGSTFDVDGLCSRAMAVTYMWQAAGSPFDVNEATFSDVSAGSTFATAVSWAVEKGITTGTSNTTFSPNDTCTRGQIATFLYRALA